MRRPAFGLNMASLVAKLLRVPSYVYHVVGGNLVGGAIGVVLGASVNAQRGYDQTDFFHAMYLLQVLLYPIVIGLLLSSVGVRVEQADQEISLNKTFFRELSREERNKLMAEHNCRTYKQYMNFIENEKADEVKDDILQDIVTILVLSLTLVILLVVEYLTK